MDCIEDRDDDRCLMHIHANILDTHQMRSRLNTGTFVAQNSVVSENQEIRESTRLLHGSWRLAKLAWVMKQQPSAVIRLQGTEGGTWGCNVSITYILDS